MSQKKRNKKWVVFFIVFILVCLACIKMIWNESILKALNEQEQEAIHLSISNNWDQDIKKTYADLSWSTNLTTNMDNYKIYKKSEDSSWQDITGNVEITTKTQDTSPGEKATFNYCTKDLSVVDDTAPKIPSVELKNENQEISVKVSSEDRGKEYQWYVASNENEEEIKSPIQTLEVTSGVKGYIYTLDNSEITAPMIERDEEGNVTNIMMEAYSSTFTISSSENSWLHVVAIDFSNNVSEVKHVEVKENVSPKKSSRQFNGIASRAANPVDFNIERTEDKAKLVDLVLDSTTLTDMKSIEILLPSNVSITNYSTMTLPNRWRKFQNSDDGDMQSFTFAMESMVNGKMESNNSLSEITKFLNGLSFDIKSPTNQVGEIEIVFHKMVSTSWIEYVDSKKIKHYYVFMPEVTTWIKAYNKAKDMKFKGLTGYLATLTSEEEHDFVYNNIAQNSGWLGGTRMLYKGTNAKIKDQTNVNKQEKIIDPDPNVTSKRIALNYNTNGTETTKWYWADGPEAGLVFFDPKTYNKNGNNILGKAPTGMYQGFNNPYLGGKNVEPNNWGNSEYVLEFAQGNSGKLWNDLEYDNANYKTGYYVEFSEYGTQKETDEVTAISHSSGIPQKIILTAYDENNAEMPDSANRFYDQKLKIGNKITITPEQFPMYDFMKMTDSTGKQILPLELTVSNVEQDDELFYALRKLTVNTRQIVVSENNQVIVPLKGYGDLISSSIDKESSSNYSLSMSSSVKNTQVFDKNIIRYRVDKRMYIFEPTIPMNYELIGCVVTTNGTQQHSVSNASKESVEINVMDTPEFWITVYIKPSDTNPTLYSWDYIQNNFGTVDNK